MITVGAMQGWQCPVCGRVLAPFVVECPCKGQLQTAITSTSGTSVNGDFLCHNDKLYVRVNPENIEI